MPAASPVHIKRDIPGFVGNRLQHAIKREAIALVAAGVCDADTIDEVVKTGFGARMAVLGPMEQSDLVGTDLTLDIQNVLLSDLNRDTEPTQYLKDLVAIRQARHAHRRGSAQMDAGGRRSGARAAATLAGASRRRRGSGSDALLRRHACGLDGLGDPLAVRFEHRLIRRQRHT